MPTRSLYTTDEPVIVEVRGLIGDARLHLLHWGISVLSAPVAGDGLVDLGPSAPGGYGVVLNVAGSAVARSAVQVVGVGERPRTVRYGFVADYRPGRDVAAVQDNIRRLHLTAVQLYDWAYRHADVVGGGDCYVDPLGNPVSLGTVRALVDACHAVGADALGYAAVYAVGDQDWDAWKANALLTATGAAYGLGGFLRLVDPAAAPWLRHLTGDLVAATELVGFDGFHLDQYGYPKVAQAADGSVVDLAASFVTAVEAIRDRLPRSRLVFNNVNDFPTWATAQAAQDAVYVEVWEPHVGYEHLAHIVTRARSLAGDKPVVIAAYQQVFDSAPTDEANQATALTMATLFSHGATHLLCGEEGAVLVDPYYVRNHVAATSTRQMLTRWYDFLVEHDELLMPAGIVEVTGSYAGSHNADLDISYEGVQVSTGPRAGAVWRRITRVGDALVLHLVNLCGQEDTRWDAPHRPPPDVGAGLLRVRRVGPDLPRIRVADPDASAHLSAVEVVAAGDYAEARLPSPATWQLVLVELTP